MTASGLAVAVLAAVAFAGCSLLQHAGTHRVAADGRLFSALLRERLWLAGTALDAVAIALQALALRLAPLAVVQPVLVCGLVVVVLIESAVRRRLPAAHDIGGAVACSSGLALFLGVVPPSAGTDHPPAVLGAALAALVIGAAAVAALGRRMARWRALWLAGWAGVEYAVAAAALQLTVRHVEHPLALLQWWPPYLLAGAGLAGMLLNQHAFRAGRLFGPLALMSVVEPVVAVVIGVAGLQQTLPHSAPDDAVLAVAALLMAIGVVLLSRRQAARQSPPAARPAASGAASRETALPRRSPAPPR